MNVALKKQLIKKLAYLSWFVMAVFIDAHAENWKIDATVNQSLGYDDNVRMYPKNEAKGSIEYTLTPQLRFGRFGQSWDVSGTFNYGWQKYIDMPIMDNNPMSFSANTAYRWDRLSSGLTFNYNETSSRNNSYYFGNSSEELDPNNNTRDFSNNSTSVSLGISPSLSYSLTQLDTLTLSGQYRQTTYSAANNISSLNSSSSFKDNDSQGMSVGWSKIWTPRLSHNVSSSLTHYNFGQGSSDSLNLNLGGNYKLSQLWQVDGTVGGYATDSSQQSNFGFQQPVSNGIQTGFLFNIGINYKNERFSSGLKLMRSLMPSAQGNLTQQTNFSWNGNYQIDANWSAGINANYSLSDNINQSNNQINNNLLNNSNNQTFSMLEPRVNWKVSRDFSAGLSYRYREQSSRYQAESNLMMLTVNYNWSGISISR